MQSKILSLFFAHHAAILGKKKSFFRLRSATSIFSTPRHDEAFEPGCELATRKLIRKGKGRKVSGEGGRTTSVWPFWFWPAGAVVQGCLNLNEIIS